jgi:3-phosphoshikimate 1-carboxyvinyltransferase
MLALFGADVSVSEGRIDLRPGPLSPVDLTVPGDPSQAAFWIVAACITPGSDLIVEDVYVGPSRAGFVDVLRRMGADLELVATDPATTTASIRARYGPLVATTVGGEEIPGLIDEIPILAVAAAVAEGTTVFQDAAELRVKESDRVETTVALVRALGVDADPRPDGLTVDGCGGGRLGGGQVDSQGDHRVAMSAAIAGLASSSPVVVAGWDAVATSYPGFEEELARCVS